MATDRDDTNLLPSAFCFFFFSSFHRPVCALPTIPWTAQNKKIEEARPLYEKIVTQFPNAGRYWKIYIEHEMKSRNFERVEKLFQRCLMKVLNIDLWRCYLTYVKETKGSLPTYREKMAQAYDFALDKMGMDILSYPIWSDYINFLKSVEAVGSYAENQRITAVRKVYQRGIINPMMNIEQLWKEYINYEQGINMLIAEKMISDRSREYMNARRVAKEYEAVTRGLNKNSPSVPPQGTPEEAKQVRRFHSFHSLIHLLINSLLAASNVPLIRSRCLVMV
ncbi:cleavage stimulation factor subunit 3, partial [Rhipicephalus sanguineus]|uniref:cleavage stimulation factor subunit 3 n=1 Tax=Rhipicephalus sanguineus TaxID=34632 RepID=UPI0020C2B4C8